jgi:uncharacterized membrane protein YkvA (DUF1232 family)
MTSEDVRAKVNSALQDEQKSHRLRDCLKQFVPESDLEQKMGFAVAYVLMAPVILDAVYNEARKHGLLQQFQPVFDAVLGYWAFEEDLIPDRLGVVGLCDDAYVSLCLMQYLASQTLPAKGVPLLSIDLTVANRNMRALIGEPAASQLDLAVSQTLGALSFQNALAALMNNPTLLNAAGGGSWAGVNSADIRRQMQEQMKKNIVKDAIRHDLARDGIFL